MRLSIFAKVAIMLMFSIFMVVVPLLYTVKNTVTDAFIEQRRQTLNASALSLESRLKAYQDGIEALLWQGTRRADLAEALNGRDIAVIERILKDMQAHSFVTIATLSDDKGTVLARSYSPGRGDSVARQINVSHSLEGRNMTLGFEGGTEVAFSLRGGAPVRADGKLVGVLSAGVRLDQPEFVDALKKELGVEVTFFKGDTRVATSLVNKDGSRMTGTRLENREILDAVLGKGQNFHGSNVQIGSISYEVVYVPLKSADGVVTGMFFLGAPGAQQQAVLDSIMSGILWVGLVMAVIIGIAGVVSARWLITKPLTKVTNVIRDLVQGKAELSFRLDTAKGDEIAMLSSEVNNLMGKVDDMLCNIEGFKNLVNAIPDPVFAVDNDYKILLANDRLCEIAGVKDPALLRGRNINEILKTDVYGSENCAIREVMKTRRRVVSEVFSLTIGGSVRHVRALCDVIKDCRGEDVGFLQVASDVTDIVEKEKALSIQMEHIAEVNRTVTSIAGQVNSSAESMQRQMGTVQDAAERQNAVMSQTLHAIQQMNETVMEIARSASVASSQAGAGQEKAAEGERIVREAMQAINSVRSLAVVLHENLTALGTQAEGIGQIMNVISDIADQTNLLALNAAIEAARAGEAGRGFAVVADEVRKLAEKTMGATQEVRSAITSIQQGASANLAGMADVAQAVEKATELSKSSESALGQIVRLVSESSAQVASIAAAAEEQSVASKHIAGSVDEVTRIAGETARQTTESVKTVNQLADLSRDLHKAVQ